MAFRAAIVHCAQIVQDSGFTGPYWVEFEVNGDQIDDVPRSVRLLRHFLG